MQVVLQVLADAGQVRAPPGCRARCRSAAGPRPESCRSCGDWTAPAHSSTSRAARTRGLRTVPPIADDRSRAACRTRCRSHGHRSRSSGWRAARAGLQVGGRRRAAQAVAGRQLEVAGAVLARAVEVVGARNAELAGGGDQGLDQRVPPGNVGDGERPVAAVERARAAGVRLRLDEIAQRLARSSSPRRRSASQPSKSSGCPRIWIRPLIALEPPSVRPRGV